MKIYRTIDNTTTVDLYNNIRYVLILEVKSKGYTIFITDKVCSFIIDYNGRSVTAIDTVITQVC